MRTVLPIVLLFLNFTYGQDESPFADEVEAIQKKYDTILDTSKETIVFTGSSSVRMWHDVQELFPEHQIVNSGFGGSKASDLVKYCDELILQYKPKKVFIYEGDNDIAAGKNLKTIISDISDIIKKIRMQNTAVKVVLIGVKPSIARWSLKKEYKRLNRKFRQMSRKDADILFVDVWKPMLDRRKVKKDIYVEDGLHMNAKGYEIWYQTIKPFLE